MTKLVVAIPRRPDLSVKAFRAHWIEPHGRLALRIRAIRRYTPSHRVDCPGLGIPQGPYDGFAEVWFDDLSSADRLGSDPDYLNHLMPDEPNFCDVAGQRFFVGTEESITYMPGAIGAGGGFKLIQIVSRLPELAPAGFDCVWARGAGHYAAALTLGVVREVRCRRAAAGSPDDPPGFDAVRELWWPNAAAFEAGRRASPDAWRELIHGPGVDPVRLLVEAVHERRVLE
jgi:hypothetical protein